MRLSSSDYEKFRRLSTVLKRNYRLTSLLAFYLSHCPEWMDKKTVDALTKDGAFSEKEAVAALLAEALGIDAGGDAEDRILYRDYLFPAVRILDGSDFLSDDYVRTVRAADARCGAVGIQNEVYPAFRAAICGDMEVSADLCEIPPLGFFRDPFPFLAVTENGNEWMTLTPADTVTSRVPLAAARGKVLTFGLGLGYYAFHAANKPSVESVTVIEKNPDVIALFREHLLPLFPQKDKIRIVEADAFSYAEHTAPHEGYDVAFVDTWRDASDGCPMYLAMKPLEKKNPGTEFHYWIEGFLLSRLRSLRFAKLLEKEENAAHGVRGDVTFDEVMKSLGDEALRRDAADGTLGFCL